MDHYLIDNLRFEECYETYVNECYDLDCMPSVCEGMYKALAKLIEGEYA
jgi:hypothetical protein